MKNSLTDVKNHLIEAMERLNDDELVQDKTKCEQEIKKAQALTNLAGQVVQIEQVQINEKNMQLQAMSVANRMGYIYKPEGMNLIEKKRGLINYND